ncbi:hypothetical protein QBC47DRAFT_372379 [Echria macrotheca]|uniref:J domain-containing protein n=1 Tax=Echria macrotheca TaxID=438768 RepID=A0AAJ0BJW6_9PEZI|nr:hypothetical protein QBC47DRAFT_372379 [Echria macrotheca]
MSRRSLAAGRERPLHLQLKPPHSSFPICRTPPYASSRPTHFQRQIRRATPMASHDDLTDGEPPVIDPYEALGIDRSATADQVKSAYRKAALKHHPDKVSEDKRNEAKEKFQGIAFAYAVLSDPARRKRYDETGSTSEAIVDSEGFSWSEYYREQFQDAISEDAINKFAAEYKGSDEEKDDILAVYEEFEGDMDAIYEHVMLSNVLEDDERIRKIIDDAIESGDVEPYKKYTKETKKSKQARIKAAQGESKEADELAKELGVYDKLRGKKSKKDSEAGLAALIQRNQASRAIALDKLAEKYGAKPKKRGAKDVEPDISDEQFEALQAKMAKKAKKGR